MQLSLVRCGLRAPPCGHGAPRSPVLIIGFSPLLPLPQACPTSWRSSTPPPCVPGTRKWECETTSTWWNPTRRPPSPAPTAWPGRRPTRGLARSTPNKDRVTERGRSLQSPNPSHQHPQNTFFIMEELVFVLTEVDGHVREISPPGRAAGENERAFLWRSRPTSLLERKPRRSSAGLETWKFQDAPVSVWRKGSLPTWPECGCLNLTLPSPSSVLWFPLPSSLTVMRRDLPFILLLVHWIHFYFFSLFFFFFFNRHLIIIKWHQVTVTVWFLV